MKKIVQVPGELLETAVEFDSNPGESIIDDLKQLTENVSVLMGSGSPDSEVRKMSLSAGFPQGYIDFVLSTIRSQGPDVEYQLQSATSATPPVTAIEGPPLVALPFQLSNFESAATQPENNGSTELILNRRPKLLFDSGAAGDPIRLDPNDKARPITEQRVSALADHFPEWDLFPAGGFVKRTKR